MEGSKNIKNQLNFTEENLKPDSSKNDQIKQQISSDSSLEQFDYTPINHEKDEMLGESQSSMIYRLKGQFNESNEDVTKFIEEFFKIIPQLSIIDPIIKDLGDAFPDRIEKELLNNIQSRKLPNGLAVACYAFYYVNRLRWWNYGHSKSFFNLAKVLDEVNKEQKSSTISLKKLKFQIQLIETNILKIKEENIDIKKKFEKLECKTKAKNNHEVKDKCNNEKKFSYENRENLDFEKNAIKKNRESLLRRDNIQCSYEKDILKVKKKDILKSFIYPTKLNSQKIINILKNKTFYRKGSIIYCFKCGLPGHFKSGCAFKRSFEIHQKFKDIKTKYSNGKDKDYLFHYKMGHIAKKSSSGLICQLCEMNGHTAKKCSSEIICQLCEEKGHFSKKCPSKLICQLCD